MMNYIVYIDGYAGCADLSRKDFYINAVLVNNNM